jgi:hypothetical protein
VKTRCSPNQELVRQLSSNGSCRHGVSQVEPYRRGPSTEWKTPKLEPHESRCVISRAKIHQMQSIRR